MGNSASRTVVVTGGSRGIGRAIALRFASKGTRIVIVHYDPDEIAAQETVAMVSQRGATAESKKVDLSDFQAVDELFKDILARCGNIHVLVNNAGITKDTLLMRMSEADWDAVLHVNLKSVFNCTKAVIRSMLKQREGRIVNISSVVGQMGNAGQSNYAASKAGIMGFTKSVAREAAPRGVTVNAVAPGYVDTDMTKVLPDEVKAAFLQQVPLGRVGTPQDVAEAVHWLCSEAAGYITGQVLHVNGGMYM